MKPVLIIKIVIDLCMSALFLLLLSYHLMSDAPHEWIGLAVFVLFLAHNALNFRWYRNLFRGKYSAARIVQTAVTLLLWIAMLGCIVSSLFISGYVFAFLNLSAARFVRALHLVSTVWAFILAAIHLGFHVPMFIGMAKKAVPVKQNIALILKWLFRVLVLGIAAFGMYVLITRRMWEEMFLLTEFKWFDYEKALAVYLLENGCLMALFAAIGYYGRKLLVKISGYLKKNEAEKQ